jgi:hypothetical protein
VTAPRCPSGAASARRLSHEQLVHKLGRDNPDPVVRNAEPRPRGGLFGWRTRARLPLSS